MTETATTASFKRRARDAGPVEFKAPPVCEGQNAAPVDVKMPGLSENTTYSIDWRCNVSDDERYRNARYAKQAGHPILVHAGNETHDFPCHVVGTGLSAVKALPELKERAKAGEQIIALKGAHDWLIKHGIVPAAAIAIDAQQARAKCFRNPQRGVVYLCASQMHPDTWEHLRKYRVVIWHALIDSTMPKRPEWQNDLIILAASTTGNSAILLLHALGRRNLHLWGIDSCIPEPSWWNRWVRPRLKLDGTRTREGGDVIEVEVGGKRFWTTTEMMVQAQEVSLMLPYIPGMKITAHGDGYFQEVIAQGKALGWQI